MNKIAFIGDIAFIGKYDLNTNIKAKEYFKDIAKYLSSFDYVIGNLEGPLTSKTHTSVCKSMHLKMNPINVELLKYLNINIVNLGNNHINDFGKSGIEDTIKTLNENNIEWFGLHDKTLEKRIGKHNICLSSFCCYSANGTNYNHDGLTPLTYNNLIRQLDNDKKKNNISFLNFHWGEEYTNYPKLDDIHLVKNISNNHSGYIIGHHPHIIQGYAKYNNMNVCYSLGNFCFDDLVSLDKKTKLIQENYNKVGQIIEYTFNNNIIHSRKLIDFKDGVLKIVDDTETIKYIDSILIDDDKPSYNINMNKQVKLNRMKKFPKRNLKWVLSKMNYNSIVTFITSKFNSNKYQKNNCYYNKDYIVYVGNFNIVDLNAAGKRVLNNSILLSQLGYKILLIGLCNNNSQTRTLIELKDNIYAYNLLYPNRLCSWINYNRKYKEVLNILSELGLTNRIKYMIFYGSLSITLFINKMLHFCKKHNITTIADVVDWLKICINNPIINILKTIDYNYQKMIVNKKMDSLIVISSYLKEYYKNKNSALIPPLVEYNSSDLIKSKKNKKIRIYYAGNPFGNKKVNIKGNELKDRIDLMINSLEETKCDFIFDIYGITLDDYISAFPKSKIPDSKKIVFHGKVNNSYLINILDDYDFSILFRDFNRESNAGFSTKIIESLSMFVPVITNNTSDMIKYIKNGKNGYILNIENKEDLINNLKKILSLDSKQIFEMKQYCKKNQLFYVEMYKNEIKKIIK